MKTQNILIALLLTFLTCTQIDAKNEFQTINSYTKKGPRINEDSTVYFLIQDTIHKKLYPKNFPYLEYLIIGLCEIDSITIDFNQLPSIKEIIINNTQYEDLEFIGQPEKSISLSLTSHHFENFSFLSKIENIHSLSLYDIPHKRIEHLFDELIKLPDLTSLKINLDSFIKIPDKILKLDKLRHLGLEYLDANFSLGETFFMIKDMKITSLSLYGNKCSTLTDSIGFLKNLKELSIEFSNIIALPDSITKLTKLETIYAEYSHLNYLPLEITEMVNLRTLHFKNTMFSSIPLQLYNMPWLEILYINSEFWSPSYKDIKRLKKRLPNCSINEK